MRALSSSQLVACLDCRSFDYRQSLDPGEPGAWYAFLPLEAVYAFDPIPLPPLCPLPPAPPPLHSRHSPAEAGAVASPRRAPFGEAVAESSSTLRWELRPLWWSSGYTPAHQQ